MRKVIDIAGQKFGRLTAVSYEGKKKWLFKCDCGKEVIRDSYSVKSGNTSSCGCYNIEVVKREKTKHLMSDTRVYKIWAGMKSRCNNKSCSIYEHYGARGITVCDEWENDSNAFIEWASSNGYRDDLTIDRIDNNKGYSPDNCRWTTMNEQVLNRRTKYDVTINGRTQSISKWCKELNINTSTVYSRIRAGHTPTEAIMKKYIY